MRYLFAVLVLVGCSGDVAPAGDGGAQDAGREAGPVDGGGDGGGSDAKSPHQYGMIRSRHCGVICEDAGMACIGVGSVGRDCGKRVDSPGCLDPGKWLWEVADGRGLCLSDDRIENPCTQAVSNLWGIDPVEACCLCAPR